MALIVGKDMATGSFAKTFAEINLDDDNQDSMPIDWDNEEIEEFQWTPYEDPTIRAVIPDEYLQNPNAWHVKVPLVNFAILEMHQSDRVLRQFGFRQPIPVTPEVLDDHHKIDLRQLHTDWPRFWSHYIQMWKDRYDYIPTQEPIIVPELAYKKGRRRRPINSAHTITRPSNRTTQSPGPTVQPSTPTAQPLQMMPGGSSSQHPQPESSPEQAQPPPEAGQRRNPTCNRRGPPCGTESDRHGH
ncbi:hypothetical protein PVK06_035742 [Gossypium arboreum]|uniref:Aminotransferase-like plant mobile domain-containing protein n=1 Tax=Gossypium arboreum TaxID=29729 RepID=A0ABR0NIS2_GOSAR|nr:hypothetical protein PVK06_035742 [Gossypium arboreum]